MTRSRVPLLAIDEAKAAARALQIPEAMAELTVFRALLAHPELAGGVHGLLSMLLWRGQLDRRLRELLIMRIGWRTGSVYEWTQHWRVALALDVDPDDLLAVRAWSSSDRLGPAERAVLAATDETLDTGTVTPATWAECEAHVGGPEVLTEMVVAIGNWRMFSSVLRSLEIPLEDGVAPWPPDGEVPVDVMPPPAR